jgi:hypothetical protein
MTSGGWNRWAAGSMGCVGAREQAQPRGIVPASTLGFEHHNQRVLRQRGV